MTRGIRTGLLLAVGALVLPPSVARAEQKVKEEKVKEEKVDGYAEFREGSCLFSDGQKVCPRPGFKFKGSGDAKDFASIPLGYEFKAKGVRQADGTLLALEAEAKPNGGALFESEVRSATDGAEQQARKAGRFLEKAADGKEHTVGRLIESGPYVDRVRGIVDTLLPPYLQPEKIRVYVIENKEWNAFAMGNYSIYVFSGLLDDMDDDEVAIVLGHELVHASHEHTRKQFKRDMIVQLIALGVTAGAQTIDDDKKKAVVQMLTGLAATAYTSGYGRGMEDQADRVGLRYAYEAGYDITKGPRLWNRFAKKYGEGDKLTNFFFGDHSLSVARAAKLEKEIAFNYPEGPKQGVRTARRTTPSAKPETMTAKHNPPPPMPQQTQALSSNSSMPQLPVPARRPAAAAAAGSTRTEIKPGMTTDEVRRAFGPPRSEVVFAEKLRWTYADMVVVFEKDKVVDVKF